MGLGLERVPDEHQEVDRTLVNDTVTNMPSRTNGLPDPVAPQEAADGFGDAAALLDRLIRSDGDLSGVTRERSAVLRVIVRYA